MAGSCQLTRAYRAGAKGLFNWCGHIPAQAGAQALSSRDGGRLLHCSRRPEIQNFFPAPCLLCKGKHLLQPSTRCYLTHCLVCREGWSQDSPILALPGRGVWEGLTPVASPTDQAIGAYSTFFTAFYSCQPSRASTVGELGSVLSSAPPSELFAGGSRFAQVSLRGSSEASGFAQTGVPHALPFSAIAWSRTPDGIEHEQFTTRPQSIKLLRMQLAMPRWVQPLEYEPLDLGAMGRHSPHCFHSLTPGRDQARCSLFNVVEIITPLLALPKEDEFTGKLGSHPRNVHILRG